MQPLAGLKVIEMGHSVAAPYAALVLSELGAEVTKIERPGEGDPCRGWGPPFAEGQASLFMALNRGKHSLAFDLRSAEARAELRKVILASDVVIQNLKPGQAEALGFGAAELCAANPRLIHASIGAFGKAGPLKDRPGYDPLMQAFSGIMGVTGEMGRPPVRVGTSIVDMGAGMWLVTGILTALYRRERTGKGGSVDTSLLEVAMGWMSYHVTNHSASGEEPKREGSGAAMIVPYQVFSTKDGEAVVGAGNDNLFRRLARLLGHPEWIEDPRYATNPARVAHREPLCAEIQDLLLVKGNAEWEPLFVEAGIPFTPVQGVAQAVAHPQVQALGMVRQTASGLRYVDLPISLDNERPASGSTHTPKVGEG
jgi:crotonobetainyl-CoA:carnitine CoA-transferase CaiB-like acyl-CoA transferase